MKNLVHNRMSIAEFRKNLSSLDTLPLILTKYGKDFAVVMDVEEVYSTPPPTPPGNVLQETPVNPPEVPEKISGEIQELKDVPNPPVGMELIVHYDRNFMPIRKAVTGFGYCNANVAHGFEKGIKRPLFDIIYQTSDGQEIPKKMCRECLLQFSSEIVEQSGSII